MNPQVIQSTDRLFLTDLGNGKFSGSITNRQEITDEFLRECRDLREYNNRQHSKLQDCTTVAKIPTGVVDHWIRQGFNIYTDKNITAKMILDRLRKEDLSAFITSDKRL